MVACRYGKNLANFLYIAFIKSTERSHSFIGTRITWGLNMLQNNITNAVAEASSIAKAFAGADIQSAGIILEHIEIGNEADIYKKPEGTWNATDYVKTCVYVILNLCGF